MTAPTDNHRLSVEPRLELVGGEWGHADNGSCSWREIGEWTIWLRFGITAVVWNIDK